MNNSKTLNFSMHLFLIQWPFVILKAGVEGQWMESLPQTTESSWLMEQIKSYFSSEFIPSMSLRVVMMCPSLLGRGGKMGKDSLQNKKNRRQGFNKPDNCPFQGQCFWLQKAFSQRYSVLENCTPVQTHKPGAYPHILNSIQDIQEHIRAYPQLYNYLESRVLVLQIKRHKGKCCFREQIGVSEPL